MSEQDLMLQLQDWFYFGLGYFNSLFLYIGKSNNVNINSFPFELINSKDPKSINLAESLQKCLISLGNLYRYQIPQKQPNQKDLDSDSNFKQAEQCYLRSLFINPLNGRAYSQLGILNANTRYPVKFLFYYSLGLMCENPCIISDKNLKFVLNKYTNHGQLSEEDGISSLLDLEYKLIGFYDLITCQNSWNQVIDRITKFGGIFVEDMENRASEIDSLMEEAYPNRHWSESVLQIVIILLFNCWRMTQFKKDLPSNTPQSCIDILYKIQYHCFKLSIRTMNLWIENIGYNQNTKMNLVSIFSDFWISNTELCFRFCEDNTIKTELNNFIVKLSKVYNSLYHLHVGKSQLTADDFKELHRRPSRHDFIAWGALPLANCHRQLDISHSALTTNESLATMIIIARWFEMIHLIYQSPEFALSFPINPQLLTMGHQTPTKPRNKVSDIMVKMAELRLQDQVEKLEKMLLKKIPIQIIPDAHVLLTHFNWVEDWIKRAKVRVIITRSTLDELDELKKGTGNLSFQARNIVRKFDSWGTKYNKERIFIDATDYSSHQLLSSKQIVKIEQNDQLVEYFQKHQYLLNELAKISQDVKTNVTSKWETYLTTDSPALLELVDLFGLQGIKANKMISKLKQNN
ncbi:hypothetical protein CONCODRAFT_97259 [Conidiobolus coronatus NRRL 28638]|uniref:Uncharacterized protein n=1 Tax=Conidiobolus coronatus (strain ATCC 28846 / CBS 209.66 / NRRL 28638) TaxID=796925 RepID=A0A137P2W5_CONC2|nr:hypothetical protein CONCODRAFT_97259 [Conidiobolus coronatus NRRL 28638]|eukprot:KXN69318.1 hypothetical protein CONCODRAFT_97259 [Conidiobolus coronatus NRRL 28638]